MPLGLPTTCFAQHHRHWGLGESTGANDLICLTGKSARFSAVPAAQAAVGAARIDSVSAVAPGQAQAKQYEQPAHALVQPFAGPAQRWMPIQCLA